MLKNPQIFKNNKKYFDHRGFFQEIYLKKKFKINKDNLTNKLSQYYLDLINR